jgi:hypothetical protein
MEVLYYIIFGGLLLFFVGYGIKLYREDKNILKELEDQEKKSSIEIPAQEIKDEILDQTAGRVLGWRDLSEEEMGIQYSEHPFIDGYQSFN